MTEKRFRIGKSILTDFPTDAIIDEKTGERYYDGIKPSYISSKELVKILNKLHEENKEIKQLIHNMLVQIEVDNINTKNTRYWAGIIFTLEEFQKMQQIWKGDFE